MSPIPSGNLPGHQRLKKNAEYALKRCQELPEVDFKRSATWEDLKFKITKTALGMSNLRDGGMIIVGVAEMDTSWSIDGILTEHLSTFDVDNVNSFVNRYASPSIILNLITIFYDSKQFLIIEVPEFRDIPIFCQKDYPNELKKGALYFRPFGKVETSQVDSEQELRDIVVLASEKLAQQIIKRGLAIGLQQPHFYSQEFDNELEGL